MFELQLEDVRRRIREIVEHAPLGAMVHGIDVRLRNLEPDDYIVHVILRLDDEKMVDHAAARAMIRDIEVAVTDTSDLFPSVYFREAA